MNIQALKYIFGVISTFAVIIIFIYQNAGNWLVRNDRPVHADNVVILMGSLHDRVIQAADLYHGHKVNRLVMCQVQMGKDKILDCNGHVINTSIQVRDSLVKLGIPMDSITILQGNANSTFDEAIMLKEYLRLNSKIDTVILVTSSSHYRRASIVLKSIFNISDINVEVFCNTSIYPDFNKEKWWKDEQSQKIVLLEYMKMVNFFLFERRSLLNANN